MEDEEEKEKNWTEEENAGEPFWKNASDVLRSIGKSLMKPMKFFGKTFDCEKHELVLCACFWIWIPLCALYMFFVAVIFSAVATAFAVIGLLQSITFVIVGVWPGVIMSLNITGISLIRLPWNAYQHIAISSKIFGQGRWVQAVGLLLLLPAQLLFPVMAGVASITAILVAFAVSFLGYPLLPWKKIVVVNNQAWKLLATEVSEKVDKYDPVAEGTTENHATPIWAEIQQFYVQVIPWGHTIPSVFIGKISKAEECGMGFAVLVAASPLWGILLAGYYITYGSIIIAVTLPLLLLALLQCVIFLALGIWPGLLISFDIAGISFVRIPWNVVYHLVIISKNLRTGNLIKAITFFLFLPLQLLAPVLLWVGSLGVGLVHCSTLSLFGVPHHSWRLLPIVHKEAWTKLATEVKEKTKAYSASPLPVSASVEEGGERIGQPEEENYAQPFWRAVYELLKVGWISIIAPLDQLNDATLNNMRTILCIPIWIVLLSTWIGVSAATFVIVIVPLLAVGFLQSLIFLLLGVWPALIISFSVTGISVLRIPWNIFYHCLVTYRTVMLRRSLKLWSFILVPPTHFIVPVVIAVLSFGASIPTAAAMAFIGSPHKPWQKIEPLVKKFWKRYVTDMEAHVNNYGHETGIPENWDGKIYGLALDPITIVMSILFYAYAVIPVSVGVFSILAIKSLPILLKSVVQYCKCNNFVKASKCWCESINSFGQWNACQKFSSFLTCYSEMAEGLNPARIGKALTGYSKDCNVTRCYPKEGIEIFCLSPCILLVTCFWLIGFVGVLIVTTGLLITGLALWVGGWPVAILLPPSIYLVCWLSLLVLLPTCYVVIWITGLVLSVVLTIAAITFYALSGPLLAVQVPVGFVKHNLLNPAEMDLSIMNGLKKPLDITKEADRITKKFSYPGCAALWDHPEPEIEAVKEKEVHKEVNYWELFLERSIREVSKVLKKGWFQHEDIEEASSAAMMAIPGFTIISVLIDSVEKEDKDKSLIYWSEKAQCTNTRRNHKDNISNHFFPLLLKIKSGLRSCSDLKKTEATISALLCDAMPDDDKTETLKEFLKKNKADEAEQKVRSELGNVVVALLRVQMVQKQLGKICAYDYRKMPPIRRESTTDEESTLIAGSIV